MSLRIAHLSDLHFGRALQPIADALLADLNTQKPDQVIISGDLTQRARRQEFIDAAQFIQEIGLPVLAIPGNHDIPLYNIAKRFLMPLKTYKKYICFAENRIYQDHQAAMMAIDTTCRYRWKSGTITPVQKQQIKSFFQQSESAHKILVTHHPLMSVELQDKKHIHSSDIPALLHTCDIDILLSGHLHRSTAKSIVADPFNSHKNYLMISAGTAISSRCRTEANAYNLIDLDAEKLKVEVRSFQTPQFAKLQTSVFMKKNLLWQVTDIL